MSQPLPRDNYTRLCVICYHRNRRTPAQWVTNYGGLTVCDAHREHAEQHGPHAAHKSKHAKSRRPQPPRTTSHL